MTSVVKITVVCANDLGKGQTRIVELLGEKIMGRNKMAFEVNGDFPDCAVVNKCGLHFIIALEGLGREKEYLGIETNAAETHQLDKVFLEFGTVHGPVDIVDGEVKKKYVRSEGIYVFVKSPVSLEGGVPVTGTVDNLDTFWTERFR